MNYTSESSKAPPNTGGVSTKKSSSALSAHCSPGGSIQRRSWLVRMLCVSRATSPPLLTIFFEMRRQRGARDCRRYEFDRLLASWRRKDTEGSIYFRTRLEMGGAPIVEKRIQK